MESAARGGWVRGAASVWDWGSGSGSGSAHSATSRYARSSIGSVSASASRACTRRRAACRASAIRFDHVVEDQVL